MPTTSEDTAAAGDEATRGAVKAKSDARKSSESSGGLVKMILSGSTAATVSAGLSCGPTVGSAGMTGFSEEDDDVEGLVMDSSLIGCWCCCCCCCCG